jgi:putative heme degradation protein
MWKEILRFFPLDMHIRSWKFASVFAFREPSHLDGHESLSFQFFDKQGYGAFKVFLNFGGNAPAPELLEKYIIPTVTNCAFHLQKKRNL